MLEDSSRQKLIRRLWEEGRAACPGVELAEERFAERVPDSESAVDLRASDLYLACACAEGSPKALALFEERILVQVPAFVSQLRLSADAVEDVRQLVRTRLFVGTQEGPPRIASYEGRGPLAGWVRAMAVRLALNLRRNKDEQAVHPGERVTEQIVGTASDPELEIIKSRYRAAFREAVQQAVSALPEEQRNVLHLHLVEGLSTPRIGALFQVNHTTVSRWLASARDNIFAETRRILSQKLGVSAAEFESLVRLVRSQLDISLAGVLGAGVAN